MYQTLESKITIDEKNYKILNRLEKMMQGEERNIEKCFYIL